MAKVVDLEGMWIWQNPAQPEGALWGPFAAREEALAHAARIEPAGTRVVVGRYQRPHAEDWVYADLERFMEELNAFFLDNTKSAVSTPFRVPSHQVAAAREALADALRAWVKQWVVSEGGGHTAEPVEVEVGQPEEPCQS